MNYASITEAYGVESLTKKKKKKNKYDIDNENENENVNVNVNDIENEISNYKIDEYKKEFNENCEPLQPPHYKLPISDKVMKNYNNAYQIFLKDRKVNQLNEKNINTTLNVAPSTNNKHTVNIYDNYNKIKFEDIKEIEPYYDEDLDNYLSINDFNSIDYEYNDPHEDQIKNELMRKNYNLKTQEPLKFNPDEYILMPKKKLKTLLKNKPKKKIEYNDESDNDTDNEDYNMNNNTETNIDVIDHDITHEPVIEEFKTIKKHKEKFRNNRSRVLEQYSPEIIKKKDPINNFYKNIINIGLFILIGIFIIFLLDLLTELALHKGMKQTVEVLIPLLEELKTLKEKK